MQHSRGGALVAIIVVIVVALMAGCIFAAKSCFGTIMAAKDDLEAACNKYIQAVDGGDFKSAYGMLDGSWKATLTEAQFTEKEQKVRDQYGRTGAKTMRNFNVRTFNGDTNAVIIYDETFDKGKSQVTYQLHRSGDGWRFTGISYSTTL
jgi:hypothetical protein